MMNTSFVKEQLKQLTLKPSETRVIGVRPTKNAMELQLVFAERVERPSNRKALADFNASDDRFGNNNVQPVWMKAMLADIAVLMPEALEASKLAIENQEYVNLNIHNPTLGGQRLRVEITETHNPTKWEEENIELAAKQDGQGNYLHWNNYAIFVSTDIVKGEPQHTFIQHTGTTRDVFDLDYSTNEVESEGAIEDAIFERKNGAEQRQPA